MSGTICICGVVYLDPGLRRGTRLISTPGNTANISAEARGKYTRRRTHAFLILNIPTAQYLSQQYF